MSDEALCTNKEAGVERALNRAERLVSSIEAQVAELRDRLYINDQPTLVKEASQETFKVLETRLDLLNGRLDSISYELSSVISLVCEQLGSLRLGKRKV